MSNMGFKVYEILKSKFSSEEAASIVDFFEKKSVEKHDSLKEVFATKEDFVNLETSLKKDFFSFENKITRQLYWINIVQLFAIVTSVFALIKFVVK